MSDKEQAESQLSQVLDIARTVRDAGLVVKGWDGRLWNWNSGVFQPTGVEELAAVIMRQVPAVTPTNLDNAIRLLKHGHPHIDGGRPAEAGLVNLRNGVLDFRTGDLAAADPLAFPWLHQLPVEWNPDATCPEVDRFLAEILPDQEHVDLVYEMMGYCLLPGQSLKKAFLLTGSGDNGKSVLLRLLQRLLGEDNCAAIPLRQLSDSRFQTARLPGKLLNACGDMGKASVADTQVVKLITGGDPITAEHKNGHPFDFTATCKLVFAANSLPTTFYHEDAWHNRWVVIEFARTFDAEAIAAWVQEGREARLFAPDQVQGMLVKVVQAAARLMERGRFDLPDAVCQAGERYAMSNSPVLQFLEEHPFTDQADAKRSELWPRYVDWGDKVAGLPRNQLGKRVDFLEDLRGKGMVERKVKGTWMVNVKMPESPY